MLQRSLSYIISVILCSAIFIESGHAQVAQTRRHVLDNGLTVLISEMPSTRSVSVYGLVKTGSAREGEYLGAGLSHFMEHMLFKGTERRAVGQISSEIQSLGGTINASTHFDYTIYTLTVPVEHFEKAADILADMLMNARFDPVEIERELDVVLSEINMYLDRPERYLSNMVFQTVFQRHPYGIPVIGYEDLLRPLTREDFLTYYHREYVPNNMIISVAGDVDHDTVLTTVKKLFKDYPRGKYSSETVPEEPDQLSARQRVEYYPTDIIRMSAAYPGVSIHDEDMAAMDALSDILGSGRSSRLYQSLRERLKIVHSVSTMNFTPQDPGLFEIEITSDTDNVDQVIETIDREIEILIAKGIKPEELEKVVNSSLKHLFMGEIEPWGVAYRTAVEQAVTGRHDFTKWYVEALQRLTPEDVVRVAKKYLRADKRSIAVLKPVSMKPESAMAEKDHIQNNDIERVVLSNGLTVLLRQDHSVPLVWVNLVMNAGLYAEPQELNGLSNLTSRVWPKGSAKYTKEEIAELTERKAIALSAFSGTQSFGFQMNFLKKDLNFSIDMLADVLTRPLFSKDEIKNEQQRILTEIAARNDNITTIASMALDEILFDGHPVEDTQLGTRESVLRINREDVVDFYQQYAVPANAVISVFGDFEKDELMKKLKASFGKWKGEAADLKKYAVKPIKEQVERMVYDDKEQAVVMTGFQGESFHSKDRYGLEVIGAILGYPFKGRMFTVIREEKGLAYTLGGGFSPMRDTGKLVFQVLTRPEAAEEVRLTLGALIADIQNNLVSQQELDDMKAYLIGRFQRSIETNSGLSFSSALNELYGLGYDYHEQYIDEVKAVTVDDVQRLANQYLSLDQAVEVTVLPENYKLPVE